MDAVLTTVSGLPLPKRLIALIDSGLWPSGYEEALRQNLRTPVSKERIQAFAPDQDRIYFYGLPFSTVAQRMAHGDKFWARFGTIDSIAPEQSVVIADFGVGSDSPILLDYRQDIAMPAVIRLKLNPILGDELTNGRRELLGWANVWLQCAATFDSFADMLGLNG